MIRVLKPSLYTANYTFKYQFRLDNIESVGVIHEEKIMVTGNMRILLDSDFRC